MLTILISLLMVAQTPSTSSGKVRAVMPGNTVMVDGGVGTVALYGVAPGKVALFSIFSKETHDALTRIAFGKVVRVERRGDAAVLYLPDGTSINETLLREGFAAVSLSASDIDYAKYRKLMDEALGDKVGVWGGRGNTPQDLLIRVTKEGAERSIEQERGIQSGQNTLSASFKFGSSLAGTVESRVVETNSTWWKFSWKVTLTNRGKLPQSVVAVVEFQDDAGFPVEQSSPESATVPAGADEIILTGMELIKVGPAQQVRKVDLKLKVAR